MPKKSQVVFAGFIATNSASKPLQSLGQDFSNGKREHFHLSRKGEGVDIVSDGFVDEDALIQSEKCNAGLENIIKLQTLRYGTIENAIKRNEDKQFFANVANIPTNVADQAQYVEEIQKDVDKLCKELGITKEELLKSNQTTLSQLYEAKAKAKASATTVPANAGEGDNK